jgi:hypothetical protein
MREKDGAGDGLFLEGAVYVLPGCFFRNTSQ